MAKLQWTKFYPADWLVDTRCLSLAARGAWIDLLSFLWNSKERGQITKNPAGFSLMLGVNENEFLQVLSELELHEIANVKRDSNGNVTIVSRRQQREELERIKGNDRVKKFRMKRSCNENVTPERQNPDYRIQNPETENTVTGAGVSEVGFSEKIQEIAFRVLGMIQPATLSEWIVDYGEEWTRDAILTAEQAGKKRAAYVTGILKRWAAEGRDEKPAEAPKKRDPVFEYLEKRDKA